LRYPDELVFVKICGVTSEEDALLATAMGADAVGFVFAPSSRQIQPSRVRDITRRLPPEILTVGVFRGDSPTRVVETVNEAGLRAAQLHGRERPEDARYVAERVPFLIKAFTAGDPLMDRAEEYGAAAILVDSPVPGSGELFDWTALDGTQRGHRLILAGGLTADNVAEAIDVVRPWGVDVSSGVEAAPGRKDPAAVRRFIHSARAAFALIEPERGDERDELGPYDWRAEV
jgi:phosphoribosylanthranilate isomerase